MVALFVLMPVCSNLIGQPAQETTTGRQLMFAPPPIEGVIGLGVFDERGKLVRVLRRAGAIDSFKAGLNGLVIQWDGNDARGHPTPPGRYSAHGVLIGDVQVDGVAFHLNDWVDLPRETRPRKILSATLLSEDRIAVLAQAGAREIIVLPSKGTSPTVYPVTEPGDQIKGAGAGILLFGKDRLAFLSAERGLFNGLNPCPASATPINTRIGCWWRKTAFCC